MKHTTKDFKNSLKLCIRSMYDYKLTLKNVIISDWEKNFDENLKKAEKLMEDDAKIDNQVIFELIKNTPIKLKDDENHCPLCSSKNVEKLSHRYTLVGGDPDPNHHWVESICKDCNRKYTREYKTTNVWYTASKDDFILAGVPSCFENYVYTCKHCGGHVNKIYRKLDGITPHTSCGLCYQMGEPQQRTFYKCKKCEKEIEYPQEYWWPDDEK